jgi:hypothetical protein
MPTGSISKGERIMSAKQTLTTLIMALALITSGTVAAAADMPDQVSLDTMASLFNGVEFDHAMHTDLGEDCSACHHHTTGTGTTNERCMGCHADSAGEKTVRCAGCHVAEPFSAEHINRDASNRYQFHIDMPGLKAAYHWNCVGCHEQMDGPTGCQDCHTRTASGDAFYHENAVHAEAAGSAAH